MARTRLSRRLERKSKKNFTLTAIGIILLFFVLFKFGIPMLANFSIFISQIGKNEESETISQKSYIAPPVLNPLPTATNSAYIIISGKSFKKQTVMLYVNDDLVSKQATDDKGEFSFTQTLEKGTNEIKAKVKQDKSESDFSDSFSVTYEDKAPELTIESPSDGQTFGKGDRNILVSGKTDSNTDVTVNGFWAVIDENNHYSYTLVLKDGENIIDVKAVDDAGNSSEKSIKVSYSQ